MFYKTNWIDLQYDASFRSPLFALAGNAVSVLAALHSKLSTKWTLQGSDLVVDGGRALSDVRARVSLFAGNGTLEVTSERFTARFNNPNAPGDTDIVKDCVRLAVEGLASLMGGKSDFQEEGITVRMFIELENGDAHAYLMDLYGPSRLFAASDLPDTTVVPGFRIEFLQEKQKCMFQFEMTRSHRNRKEVFVNSGARFYSGTPLVTLDEKADLLRKLVEGAIARVGLEPKPTERK